MSDNTKYKRLILIPGDSLFDHDINQLTANEDSIFFMAEDYELCTHFKYHKQKLVFFLAAMRNHRDTLIEGGNRVEYFELEEKQELSYTEKITIVLEKYPEVKTLVTYQIPDKFFEKSITGYCNSKQLNYEFLPNPKFLFSRFDFAEWLKSTKTIRMHNYYIDKRKELNLLINDGEPVGGKWSLDSENRKKIPKDIEIPQLVRFDNQHHVKEVKNIVERIFNQHPGSLKEFNWAVTRSSALIVLNDFIEKKLNNFGPYQDGISADDSFIFHSTISPYLNSGLITPAEVIEKVLEVSDKTRLSSIEGFIRQVIGWREFMFGIYQHKDLNLNFWKHTRKLSQCWYDGKTGIPPVDDCIKKVNNTAYLHHIERLMIMGNVMLLCEIDPNEVYRWFMEMFIDSADWVMAGNVYGMSQFADGGIFATKPYISGSNYIKKMSDYGKADWNIVFDGLYWRFIDKHRGFFSSNPRLNMMVNILDKKSDDEKSKLFNCAEEFINRVTIE
ncbi:cryptochrome/photolyase family protein [Marinigracilibium pacificum]|uniref:Cryptochrome/photolyase family protein n=1 Tax=Marinigracilibium pacificum TaxID=2729599 RepID=A0A848IUS0_9BACT|nr:cryptochrome/photolyase family protein [Marinigracilibium pacificum]NMM46938.1 cryptochrome/photolyase family protein [Marinigracilibium pacificum]